MEMNEIKSQLASLLNFGKVNTQASGSDAFAQLLNRSGDEKSVVREPAKTTAASDDKRPEERKSRPEDKAAAADRKEKPAKTANRNETDKKEAVSQASSEIPSQEKSPQADKTAADRSEISTNKDAPVEASESQQDDSGEAELTVSLLVPLNELALMGTINVINPETGELMQMTGAELAARLAGDDTLQVLMTTPENGEAVFSIAPVNENKIQVPAKDSGMDISAFEPVEKTENIAAVLQNAQPRRAAPTAAEAEDAAMLPAEDLADDKISEQASKLAEVIGKEKKTEVKVSVHEEKIARLAEKNLLADTEAVDEAVSASNAAAAKKTPAVSQGTGNVNLTSAAGGSAQNLNAAPIFNAAAPAPADAVSSGASASMSDTGAVHLAAASAGSEFVQAAKAEAANQNNQTSFRDVYKGMGKEVVEQVKVNITKSAVKGIDKIDISLKPEDLGHIEVKMQIGKDGKLSAHIISSRPETMEALQKEMQSLEKAFNDAGFQTDEGSLSFSFREQANQNQERENGLRHFIGDIFEKETSTELVSGDMFQTQTWDGKSGLNIRV